MGLHMSTVNHIIEDVITVAMYNGNADRAFIERQIADCVVALIIRRTMYRHAVAKIDVFQGGVVKAKVDLYDSPSGKPVALVEYSNALHRQVRSRKL